jgi:PPK2 family polyphosphate:nucleotide phosphotransferase
MKHWTKYRVKPGSRVNLNHFAPDETNGEEKGPVVRNTRKLQKRMDELQMKLGAERKRSVLICLQAMDAGGKDGVIRHVVSSMSPQGCRVVSFKEPAPEELAHDFLWRIERQTPQRGEVVIFNRSHYEDVLVVRVHKLVPKNVWQRRYEEINHFEERLADNGTQILKFFLHISKEEQLDRFKRRLSDPTRQWKVSESDYKEREFWSDYQAAYEEALSKCSTEYAPWFVIPSDHKWFRNFVIAQIIVDALDSMRIRTPMPTVDLDEIRRKYHKLEKGK